MEHEAPLTSARISREALATLLEAYRGAGGREPCGLLLGHVDPGTVRIDDVIATNNDHPKPDRAFRIPVEEHAEARRKARHRGLEIVGHWHGHLRGRAEPGEQDRRDLAEVDPASGEPHAMLIIGRGAGTAPVIRGYVRRNEEVREIRVGRR